MNRMTNHEQLDWENIVHHHGGRVFCIAYRILGSVHDAEDVSQEVFVEAYRMEQAGPVQSWSGLLGRIATLRAIDRLRRTRRREELHDYQHISHTEPFHDLAASELREWLRNAMAQLPDQQAAVFAMTCLQQLPRQQVAENLEISPEAVSTALYKARQRLGEQLAVFNRGE